MYEGRLQVKPCATYSYILTLAAVGSKTVDIEGGWVVDAVERFRDFISGDLKVPCDGEYFFSPIGTKFIAENDDIDNIDNFGIGN